MTVANESIKKVIRVFIYVFFKLPLLVLAAPVVGSGVAVAFDSLQFLPASIRHPESWSA